jgi:hypothetical protein
MVRHLRRGVERDHAVEAGHADRAVRLDRHVGRSGILERLLEHHVRRGQRGVDVAERERDVLADVAALGEGVDLVRLVVVRQRVLDREHGGQHLVVDVDQRERLGRGELVHGGDAGDGVAHVADLLETQRVLVARPGDDAVRHRQVLARDRGDHAGMRQRPRHVDALDAGVGMRRAQDLREQHAREHEVVGEDRHAGDLLAALDLAVALPDDRETGLGLRGGFGLHRAARSALRRAPAFKQASKIFV